MAATLGISKVGHQGYHAKLTSCWETNDLGVRAHFMKRFLAVGTPLGVHGTSTARDGRELMMETTEMNMATVNTKRGYWFHKFTKNQCKKLSF